MEKYINEWGKECYRYIEPTDRFDESLFVEVDHHRDGDTQYALHTNLGSITVLNRMTGFGWRDVETGYRDPLGNFWLASCNFDIRHEKCKTFSEAIELIKANSNNCIPGKNVELLEVFTDASGGVR